MPKFLGRATEVWIFAPDVADHAAPSRAELTAGTVLSEPGMAPSISATDGFTFENQPVPIPSAENLFDTTIRGIYQAGTPSLTFYDDTTDTAIRTALTEGTQGFIVRMRYGDVPAKRCEVWPVEVAGINDSAYGSDANPATFTVTFAVPDAPEQNAVVPAAV